MRIIVNIGLIIVLGLASHHSHAQYWAKLDNQSGTNNTFDVLNLSEEPIQCHLRAGHDNLWMQLGPEASKGSFKLDTGFRIHQVSLYCKPIKQISKNYVWRKNQYQGNPPSNEYTLNFNPL